MTYDQEIVVKIRNIVIFATAMAVFVAYVTIMSITYITIISVLLRLMLPCGAAAMKKAWLAVFRIRNKLFIKNDT